MQAMLLRFTETGEIQPVGVDVPAGRTDVRLITATNRDLRAQIAAGAFREDLYYRLNVIQIRIPPLRDRGPDVLLLFRHYLQQASEAHRLRGSGTDDRTLSSCCSSYAWPGNVRELRNITERLALRDSNRAITAADLALRPADGERQWTGDRGVNRRSEVRCRVAHGSAVMGWSHGGRRLLDVGVPSLQDTRNHPR